MAGFPQQITSSMPSDNELILGTVTSINPLIVAVRGGVVNRPGVLGSYIPGVGDPVQMMRQNATWLILGPSASSGDASNTISGYNNNTSAATTVSAAYTNINPAFASFTKRFASTSVRVDLSASSFITVAANTKPRFGFDFINNSGGASSRFDIMEMLINPLSTHTSFSASAKLAGVVAGSYTVQLIWLRVSGGGTLNINSDDWVSFLVSEVA